MPAERLIGMPDFFPSLINAMPDGFVLRAVDGAIVEANASFCRIVGYPREEVIGSRPPHPWWAEEDRDNADELASRFFAGAAADDDMVYKRKSGERVYVAVTSAPLRDGDGQIIGYVGTVKDMTERKRSQRQLDFQARLIDQVQAGIIATDDDGVITLWNRGAEELYGWGASEVIGVDIVNVLPGFGAFALGQPALETLRAGQAWEGECVARARDGSTFPVFVTDAPLLDHAGELAGVISISVSIAERRRSERRRSAQYDVSRILADVDEMADGLRATLAAIGENLGWSFGCFWALDAAQQALRCLYSWTAEDHVTPVDMERLTEQWAYRRGQGLLGKVWDTRQPEWVANIEQEPAFLRGPEAMSSGFQSWIAFPVIGRRGVFGAIEMFATQPREPEPELIALLTSFGRQVGQFIERKRAEGALRESEDRFRVMADNAPVMLWIADATGAATWFNRGWLDLRGRTLEEEIGNGWMEGVHPADFDTCVGVYETARLEQRPYSVEYRLRRHDGAYRWLLSNAAPRFGADGAFEGFVGSCIDITDRKRVEEDLRFLSEATRILGSSLEYEQNLESLAALVVTRLADWCVITLRPDEDAAGRTIVAHRDPDRAVWARAMLARYPMEIDAPYLSEEALRDPRPILIPDITDFALESVAQDAQHLAMLREAGLSSAMIAPIVARGKGLGALAFISAEGGRRYGEEDLDIAQHLGRRAAIAIDNALLYREARESARQRDQFLAVAAHELRSPLTSMKGFAQLMLRRAQRQPLGEEWMRPLRTIDDQVNRVSGLVNRLLDISRIEEHQLHLEVEEVDLAETLRVAVAEAQLAAESNPIVCVLDSDPMIAEVDQSRIQQVLSNLIDNAVKFSPGGAPVTVSGRLQDERVVVSVADLGPGIDPELRSRLFERYFRGKRSTRNTTEGLGLGLYVSRGIVESHGGTISVESAPGEGTIFTISLPVRQSARAGEGQ